MTDRPNRLYVAGQPDPDEAGLAILPDSGSDPDPEQIELVARALGRPAFLVDADGYECDILAAATHPGNDLIAYVESRARASGGYVEVTFRLHMLRGGERSAPLDLKTYNPYFGCDVRHLQWYGDVVVLIYREKHRMYACRWSFGSVPSFVELEDDWSISGNEIGYQDYGEEQVRRRTLPDLNELPPLSEKEAEERGLLNR